MDTLTYPAAIAYFAVRTPIDMTAQDYGLVRGKQAVEAYLYGGALWTDAVRPASEDDTWQQIVQVVDYRGVDALRSRVQQQRDRFASGNYGTTEPVFLEQITPAG